MGWADALQGAGAWLGGNGPQYMQAQAIKAQAQSEQEKLRRQAFIQEGLMAESMIKNGRPDQALALFESRVQAGEKLPPIAGLGGNFDASKSIRDMLRAGDVTGAYTQLATGNQILRDAGIIKPENNATDYQASNKQYINGTVSRATRSGGTEVYDPAGNKVEGEDRIRVLREAQQAEIAMSSGKAGGAADARQQAILDTAATIEMLRVQGANLGATGVGGAPSTAELAAAEARARDEATAEGKRNQGVIDLGYDSAKAIPSLRRALALMQQVKTGGVASLSNAVLKTLGIQDANAAEAENLFNAAVLAELRPTFGSQFTVKEGDWLKDINANFGKSVDGNIRLLESGINKASRYANYGMARAIDRDDMRTADEIRDLIGGGAPRGTPATPRRRSTDTPNVVNWDDL